MVVISPIIAINQLSRILNSLRYERLLCALDKFQRNGRISFSRLFVKPGETRKELVRGNKNGGDGEGEGG